MNGTDAIKLQQLACLLDLAYMHYLLEFTLNLDLDHKLPSREGTIQVQYGDFSCRSARLDSPTWSPGPELEIESVVVCSSVFSAAKETCFDSLDEAIAVVQTWYDYARRQPSEI